MKKIPNSLKAYLAMFWLGILAGMACRLSDIFPYDSLWSLSSIATLFGFWIASAGAITWLSSSNGGAFLNVFLYLFGMTASFYSLKYLLDILGQEPELHFQTSLFLLYTLLSLFCAFGCFVLFCWNQGGLLGSVLYALPAGGLLAEALACLLVLLNRHMLLGQTLFDFAFGLLFGVGLFRQASNKVVYLLTLLLVVMVVFFKVYQPFLLTV